MKLKYFIVLTFYELTWILSVFGEIYFDKPLTGFVFGLIFVVSYFLYEKNSFFIKILLLIAIPGYLFDSFLVFSETYTFISSFKFGLLPIWMITLWLSFATLFYEVLFIIKKYRFSVILFIGFFGPFTYYLGEPLGVIRINNLVIFLISMVLFWILLMTYYLIIVLKVKSYSDT